LLYPILMLRGVFYETILRVAAVRQREDYPL